MSDTTTAAIPAPTVITLTPAPLIPQTPVPPPAETPTVVAPAASDRVHEPPEQAGARPQPAGQPPSAKQKSGILRVLGLRMRSRSSVLLKRVGGFLRRDDGMSTAEYAVGTVAAVAFSAALYKVVTSDVVTNGLSAVIGKALNATF